MIVTPLVLGSIIIFCWFLGFMSAFVLGWYISKNKIDTKQSDAITEEIVTRAVRKIVADQQRETGK